MKALHGEQRETEGGAGGGMLRGTIYDFDEVVDTQCEKVHPEGGGWHPSQVGHLSEETRPNSGVALPANCFARAEVWGQG